MKRLIAISVTSMVISSGCRVDGEALEEHTLHQSLSGSSLGMVVDNATGSATVFNADTNEILGTLPGLGVNFASGDCSITSDGTKAFFTQFDNIVNVGDLTTNPPTIAGEPNPIAISNPGEDTALSADGRFLLVCDGSAFAPVSVVDVATQTEISTFNTGGDCDSVDVCSDGSVLVTSFIFGTVRRLQLSASGTLGDTGETLGSGSPVNVNCSPGATSGIVVDTSGAVTSFTIPGLAPVTSRTIGGPGLSAAINHAGDRAYFRSSAGPVTGFIFNQTTGVLGADPIFQVSLAGAIGFFGMEQLAVHPTDAAIYVTQPGFVQILDASTGAGIGSFSGGSMSEATGICFGSPGQNEPPVAVCADRTVAADGTCHAEASIDGGSFDPDGDAIQCVQVPSGPFDEGTTVLTLTCTDSHGDSSSCTGTVTVVDQAAPELTCPADQTLECNDGAGGAAATFTATAIDNCSADPTVTCVPPSGSTFLLGATAAICSASDDEGNTGRCSHTVTVQDTAPPTVVTSEPAPLWPPNHKLHRIDLEDCITSVDDACRGPLDIGSHAQVTCCTSDEPDGGGGDGDTSNDCVLVDSDSVDVRAERDGNGNGRVYTIHYAVTDGSNNTSEHVCKVTVPHSRNGRPAIDDGPRTSCP
jgi:hypothetical protein